MFPLSIPLPLSPSPPSLQHFSFRNDISCVPTAPDLISRSSRLPSAGITRVYYMPGLCSVGIEPGASGNAKAPPTDFSPLPPRPTPFFLEGVSLCSGGWLELSMYPTLDSHWLSPSYRTLSSAGVLGNRHNLSCSFKKVFEHFFRGW